MEDKDMIIKQNIGLVKKCAGKFKNKYCYDDLVQEGLIALFLASNNFDESKGVKFSTFATIYIINSIKRFLDINQRTIRIPINKIKILNSYFYLYKNIINDNHNYKNKYSFFAKKLNIKETDLINLINAENDCISLDKIYKNEEDNSEAGDMYKYLSVEDESYKKIEEEIDNNYLLETINVIMENINEKERKAIIEKYKLFGYEENKNNNNNKGKKKRKDHVARNAIKKLRKNKKIQKLKELIM